MMIDIWYRMNVKENWVFNKLKFFFFYNSYNKCIILIIVILNLVIIGNSLCEDFIFKIVF